MKRFVIILLLVLLALQARSQCVGSQTASMSPVGPYVAGQVVTVTYTLSSFTQLNSNWIIAFDIDYANGWSSISPLSAPGNPGGSGGSWIWDVQNTYSNGLNFGPGYRFQNNGNSNYGTNSDGPFTLSFQLVVGNSCLAQDLSIDITVIGDCQSGGWNGGSCCIDPSYTVYTGNSIPTSNNISLLDNSSDVSCYGSSDGSISLNISGGISPYSYSWSNGANTASINNLIAGSYDVIVTDAAGCTGALNNIIINDPLEMQITINTSDVSCYSFSDGGISLNISGGISPYSYSWSNGATTASINNLSAGSYDVIVTDASGCTGALNNIIINDPLEIQTSSNISDVSCYGSADGSISLNINSGISPYTYSWSNGATTASINNLIAGSYDVIVTDASGCTATINSIINEASTLVYVLNTNDPTCFGAADGSANLILNNTNTVVSDSVSNLSYCPSYPSILLIQPSAIIEEVILNGDNNNINNNTAGVADFYEDYTASMYSDMTLGQPYSISITLNGIAASGSSLNLSGGKVFIDYNIDGDFIDPGEEIGVIPYRTTATVGVPEVINFTVPANSGTGATRMRVVSQYQSNPDPSAIGPCDAAIGMSQPWFGATEDYSIVLNSPTVSATYLWSTGETADSISLLTPGNYSVDITDANGCVTTENFSIYSGSQITVVAGFDQSQCEGIIPNSLSALGSTAGNNYSWSPSADFINSNVQNPVFTNPINTTTIYTVTYTDNNACISSDSVTITVTPSVLTPLISHN